MGFIDRFRKSDYQGNYYLLLAILFCIALRLLTPQMIGGGGDDAVESWDMARRILFGEDYYFIHRTTRFGTIIPVYLTQLLFGTHPLVYYIAPAIASVIQTIFLFRIANIIRGPFFAFVTTLLYLSFPQMIRELSHPRVSVFSTMFLLISLYYALRFYMDCTDDMADKKPESKDLIISGINIFFLYLAKEDSLYFLPAIMLIIFLSRKRFTDLILFGIIPFSLFISETLIYHYCTEFSLGRLSVITGKHFDTVPPLPSWFSLFDRFKGVNLRPYFRYPLFLSLLGGVYIFIRRFRDERRKINPVVFIVVALLMYVFFLTFLVKSIHPVIPLNTFRTRYMNIIIPLMILILTYIVFDFCGLFKYKKSEENSTMKNNSFINVSSAKILFIFMILYTFATVFIFSAVYKKEMYKGSHEGYLQMHPFRLVYNYNRIIAEDYSSGKPLIIRGVKERVNRFKDVVNVIEEWINSGMTVQQACFKYGITVDKFNYYKTQTQDRVTYDAFMYIVRVFLSYDQGLSVLKTFDIKVNGDYYRVIYNSRLTDRDKVKRSFKNGIYGIPVLTYPPFGVSLQK